MSQQDIKSSDQIEQERLLRQFRLDCFRGMIDAMLEEKAAAYGHDGGFYETNNPAVSEYTHALGEAKLKLTEAGKTADPELRRRLLVKAATWTYLIYESELAYYGPK